MILRLPVRRYLQGTEKTQPPLNRLGSVQWVLTRPMCRFQTFSLAQVPSKNRSQALALELAQWTPFAKSAYYVGWQGHQALVWAWDADKVESAIVAQGLKPQKVRVLPETVLQLPLQEGVSLTRCQEGFEGQLWHQSYLERSRWWPQVPQADEWLMFQRDAAIAPPDQQSLPPIPRDNPLQHKPWISERSIYGGRANQTERLLLAVGFLLLWVPSCWFGFGLYKTQQISMQLQSQMTQLQVDTAPINLARGQALDHLARIDSLRALDPYPGQIALMATVAQALPKDNSYLKDWSFLAGQLKVTLSSKADLSTTQHIAALQTVGAFRDVKALPGPDPKNVTFQMDITANAP